MIKNIYIKKIDYCSNKNIKNIKFMKIISSFNPLIKKKSMFDNYAF